MEIIDNNVLLTNEEYEHLKAKSTRIPIDKDGNFIEYAVYDTDRVLSKPEYRDYVYNKARKETAREICLKIIKDLPLPIQEKWKEFFAKQYGVEVK